MEAKLHGTISIKVLPASICYKESCIGFTLEVKKFFFFEESYHLFWVLVSNYRRASTVHLLQRIGSRNTWHINIILNVLRKYCNFETLGYSILFAIYALDLIWKVLDKSFNFKAWRVEILKEDQNSLTVTYFDRHIHLFYLVLATFLQEYKESDNEVCESCLHDIKVPFTSKVHLFSQPAKSVKSNAGGGSFCWIGIQYAIPYSQNTLFHLAFSAILPAGLICITFCNSEKKKNTKKDDSEVSESCPHCDGDANVTTGC